MDILQFPNVIDVFMNIIFTHLFDMHCSCNSYICGVIIAVSQCTALALLHDTKHIQNVLSVSKFPGSKPGAWDHFNFKYPVYSLCI